MNETFFEKNNLKKYNFEININFTKYLNEKCLNCFDDHFLFKYFPKYAFNSKILPKLSGCFWLL